MLARSSGAEALPVVRGALVSQSCPAVGHGSADTSGGAVFALVSRRIATERARQRLRQVSIAFFFLSTWFGDGFGVLDANCDTTTIRFPVALRRCN